MCVDKLVLYLTELKMIFYNNMLEAKQVRRSDSLLNCVVCVCVYMSMLIVTNRTQSLARCQSLVATLAVGRLNEYIKCDLR